MSLVLNVEILGEYKDLTRATKGAQGDLKGLDDRIGGFSKSAKAAFLSIGAGLSFAFIARELGDAAKAAVEDTKSQAILAKQLQNSTGANDKQIASVEKSITKWQALTSVADDKLRPAMASLVRSTGDVEKSSKLMSIALDVAAGTGKDLEAVALAMGKSVNGSDTALLKLMPSLKGVKDPMKALADEFKGAAEAAANNDPYAKMQVIFGEMQETIGMALLPTLSEFSTWLTTPEGEEKLQAITDGIVLILTSLGDVVKWVSDNGDWLAPLVIGIGAVTAAWMITKGVIDGVRTAIQLATAAQLLFNAASNAPQGLGKLGTVAKTVGVVGTVGAVLSLGGDVAKPGTSGSPYLPKTGSTARTPLTGITKTPNTPLLGKGATGAKTSSIVINNYQSNMTADQIVKQLNKQQKNNGNLGIAW